MFSKATKRQAKLRLTFDGPAGSGKTYSSLLLARQLGGRIALVDTEHGSASKYAHLFEFDTVALKEFSLDTYCKAINAAAAEKYDVLVIDSLSHAWTGKGGALEEVDRRSTGQASKFTSGWREVTPKHNLLIDTLLAFPGHLICTMRTKMEYVLEEDAKGKKVPRKVGMAPVQRDGMEYEFDVVADLDIEGHVTIAKTRCPDFAGAAGLLKHGDVEMLGDRLRAWLSDGAEALPVEQPAPLAPVNGHRAAPSQASAKTATEPRPNSQTGKPSKMTAQEAGTAHNPADIVARHDLRVMNIWKRAQALGMTKDTVNNWRLSTLQGENVASRDLTDAHMKMLEDDLAEREIAKAGG